MKRVSEYLYHYSTSKFQGHDADCDGTVTYTELETYGDTLDEMLDHATIGREDWHGNDRDAVSIGELSNELYVKAVQSITTSFNAQYAYRHASDDGKRVITAVANKVLSNIG